MRSTKLTPYVGAGLGLGFIGTNGLVDYFDGSAITRFSTGSKSITNFAWNIGAGVGYNITDSINVDAGYRFVGLGSVKTRATTFTTLQGDIDAYGKTRNVFQHRFDFGIRYTF